MRRCVMMIMMMTGGLGIVVVSRRMTADDAEGRAI